MIIKLVIFALGTVGIVFLSFKSAGRLRSYGLVRFFAFECILALILLNVDYWFRDPFSALQILSWLVLIAAIVTVSCGYYMLHNYGKAKDAIDDTQALITSGIYGYIRHPLYSSLIMLAVGVFLKHISPLSVALVVAAVALSAAIAVIEEKENVRKFGDKYREYSRKTKRFIPFVV